MDKHTPGPWEVWKGNFEVFAGPAQENTSCSIAGYRTPIAKCGYAYDDGYILSRAECRANARLIAAAPALLAACRAALRDKEDIPMLMPSHELKARFKRTHELLRAAIAAAEGQTTEGGDSNG